VSLTGGQRNDVTQLMPLLAAIPPVRGRRGRPRQRPDRVYADRGYDHDKYRRQVRANGITPVIARRGTGHGSGLGVHRWVVEQSIALLHWFRGQARALVPRRVISPRFSGHLNTLREISPLWGRIPCLSVQVLPRTLFRKLLSTGKYRCDPASIPNGAW
jgi:hypothetical protein